MPKLDSVTYRIFTLVAAIILLTTCKNEYSYEGGPSAGISNGTAVYTFEGAGGTCTGSIVAGDYHKSTPLNASNTVTLQVHVSTIGTYNVSTTKEDGVKFTASGNFTDTGRQAILLVGTGTPADAGVFNFETPSGSACFFTLEITEAPVVQATYTLEGSPGTCVDFSVHGTYYPGVPLNNSNTMVDVRVNVTGLGAYTIQTDTLDGISFSHSGTFTATGIQTVTLEGNGTPETPQNLSFTPKTPASNCSFDLTVQNAEPVATYVLESGFGNPNPCTFTVAGGYAVNTPLNGSNTVSIHVFVTYPGNFTISTGKVNGMEFSYTGVFPAIGAQTVVLEGHGTPTTAGSTTFAPRIVGPHPLGGETCAFYVTVN